MPITVTPGNPTATGGLRIWLNPKDAINTKDDEAIRKLLTETGLHAQHGRYHLIITANTSDWEATRHNTIVHYSYDMCLISMPCVCTRIYQDDLGKKKRVEKISGTIEGLYLGTINNDPPQKASLLTFQRRTNL